MKSVEQLLALSKNPYYKFTNDEKVILDDFLAKKREKAGKNSQSPNEKNSENDTPVRVRNIVPKTVDRVEEAEL
jgi:hypothetical protein